MSEKAASHLRANAERLRSSAKGRISEAEKLEAEATELREFALINLTTAEEFEIAANAIDPNQSLAAA